MMFLGRYLSYMDDSFWVTVKTSLCFWKGFQVYLRVPWGSPVLLEIFIYVSTSWVWRSKVWSGVSVLLVLSHHGRITVCISSYLNLSKVFIWVYKLLYYNCSYGFDNLFLSCHKSCLPRYFDLCVYVSLIQPRQGLRYMF